MDIFLKFKADDIHLNSEQIGMSVTTSTKGLACFDSVCQIRNGYNA